MNGDFFEGRKLFTLYAEQGLPLEMSVMRVHQAGATVEWPSFIKEARRNGWNDHKTYTTITTGVRDSEIFTRQEQAEFERMAKLYFLGEHAHD